jgi:hypothetical protein
MNNTINDLLFEIDFCLDSIFPIEERVTKKQSIERILLTISQLRGQLLSMRDDIVRDNDIKGRKELYHPLEALPLELMRNLYNDMPDNLAEKHFDSTTYNKCSKRNRGVI